MFYRVGYSRGCGDDIGTMFLLQALMEDLHVQQT